MLKLDSKMRSTIEEAPCEQVTLQFVFVWFATSSLLLGVHGGLLSSSSHWPNYVQLIRFTTAMESIAYGAGLATGWFCVRRYFSQGSTSLPTATSCLSLVMASRYLAYWLMMLAAKHRLLIEDWGAFRWSAPAVGVLAWLWLAKTTWRTDKWAIYAALRLCADVCWTAAVVVYVLFKLRNTDQVYLLFNYDVLFSFGDLARSGFYWLVVLVCLFQATAWLTAVFLLWMQLARGEHRGWVHALGIYMAIAAPLLEIIQWMELAAVGFP